MSEPLSPLVSALRAAAAPTTGPAYALATVTALTATGVRVRFDGESVASTRDYMVAGCTVLTGNRVLMVRAGSTWVVTGVVDPYGLNLGALWLMSADQGGIVTGIWTTVNTWTLTAATGYASGATVGGGMTHSGGVFTVAANAGGLYRLDFVYSFGATVGNIRAGRISYNGTPTPQTLFQNSDAGIPQTGVVPWFQRLAPGDTIQFQVYQNSGANLTLKRDNGVEQQTWAMVQRIGY